MARLVIFDDRVRAVDLPPHTVIIGRSLRSDIPISDPLLSRKHCTITRISNSDSDSDREGPEGERYRFADLRSANGSWVNGKRVECAELECDDVVEIGTTVMVLLDADTWTRGDGLARLRHPVKAQELVQRIHRQAQRGRNGRPLAGRGGESRSAIDPEGAEESFARWVRGELRCSPLLSELLEQQLGQQLLAAIVQRVPGLRAAVAGAFERVFVPESFLGGPDAFHAAVRIAIRDALGEVGLAAEKVDRPDPARDQRAAGGVRGEDDADTALRGDPVGDERTPREDDGAHPSRSSP